MEARLDDLHEAGERERHRIGELDAEEPGIGVEPAAAELPAQVPDGEPAPDRGEGHGSREQPREPGEHEDGRHEQARAREIEGGVCPGCQGVALARDHDDLERGGRDHQADVHTERRGVTRKLRIAEPAGQRAPAEREGDEAREATDRERAQRVRHVPRAGAAERRVGQEVVEALGHPELAHPVQRGRDQEELLVRAELRLVEDPGQHERDEERGDEAHRPPRDQGEHGAERRLDGGRGGSVLGDHVPWSWPQLLTRLHTPCTWQLMMAGEKRLTASTQEFSQSIRRGSVSSGWRGSRWVQVV